MYMMDRNSLDKKTEHQKYQQHTCQKKSSKNVRMEVMLYGSETRTIAKEEEQKRIQAFLSYGATEECLR